MIHDPVLAGEDRVVAAVELAAARLEMVFFKDPVAYSKAAVVVPILNGGLWFSQRLVKACRQIPAMGKSTYIPLALKSYSADGGFDRVFPRLEPEWNEAEKMMAEGRDIVLVDDINETGTTLEYAVRYLRKMKPKRIAVICLVHRIREDTSPNRFSTAGVDFYYAPLQATHQDGFLYGCGMDLKGEYRNLPVVKSASG